MTHLRDLASNLDLKRGLSPKAAGTGNTAYVSEILDTRSIRGAVFAILIGANTDSDATFTTLVEDGDQANLSDATAVDDAYLIGTEAQASFTAADDDNEVRKIGYVGNKRYVRVTITPAANDSGNNFVAGVWITDPLTKPAANPPA